jgi:acetyl esterase/lipase
MVLRSVVGAGAAIVCLSVWAASADGDEPAKAAAPQVQVEQDIVYTKASGTELKLDVSRPATGDGLFPAVVVIHGGAWRAGNKSDVRGLSSEFARRGYVAVGPQYRFCPKDAFPAQVHDVKAAVRWIKSNAKRYKVDPDRVGAVGFSAGGHLALMLGLTSPSDGLEGDVPAGAPDSRVKAVVNYFGPSDLAASDIPEICKPWVKDFLGGMPTDKPEAAAKASPLTFVSNDDAPVLTFQGTKDALVPYNQAIKLADAMNAKGVAGRVELIVGAQHGWAGPELERTVDETFRFFDKNLKAKPAQPKP